MGVGWEKSVSAEPVQRGKGANLLLPGHALTGTVKDCGSTRPDPNSAAHMEARVSRLHAPPCVEAVPSAERERRAVGHQGEDRRVAPLQAHAKARYR